MKKCTQSIKKRVVGSVIGVSLILTTMGITAGSAQANDFEDYLQNLSQYFLSYLGSTGVPDFLKAFFDTVKGEMSSGGKTASATENGSEDSYAIKEDVADEQQRDGVLAYLNSQNLSQEAQEATAETRQKSTDAADKSEELATDSESLDTSQQILQNISAQLGKQATISNLSLQELSQTREQLAMNAVLLAQSTKELNQITTSSRQDLAASRNQSIIAAGLFSLPGTPVVEAK